MTDDDSPIARRTPWHLWLVGILGLLWNAVGALDFTMTQSRNDAYMGQFTPEQIASLYGFPMWLVAFWGLAVWGGVLGALLLLLRRSLSVPVLLVSLVAMSVTAIHSAFFTGGLYATSGTGPGFVVLIFLVALGLLLYAQAMRQRGVVV